MSKLKEKLGTDDYAIFSEMLKKHDIKESEVDILEGYVPRARLNEVSDKLKETEKANKTLTTQYEEQKKLIGESEKFKEETETWKNKYTEQETKHAAERERGQKEIENVLKRSLVKERFLEKKAKYPDLLLKQINLDEITLKDDKLFGFDDTMKSIEESYSDMFPTTENTGNPSGGGTNNNPGEEGDDDFSYLDNIKS